MLTGEEQNNFYFNLGIAIRKARLKNKISQEELSHHLNLSRASVVNIEKGRQKVQVHTLLEIGKYLGISIDYLLNSSLNQKIDTAINKEIKSDKMKDIEKIKEFVSLALSKNSKN